MKKHILILIIGLTIFYSCGNKENQYFQNESEIVNEKILYNLSKIQEKYLLNPGMAKPYFEVASFLDTTFDTLLHFVDQGNLKAINDGLINLDESIKSISYFNSEYINEIIIPNQFKTFKSLDNKKITRLDLLNLENELVSYLFNRIEADYYKFNKLSVVVVDSSDNIKVGDIYQANIILAAEDTTIYPSIIVTDFSQPDSLLNAIRPDNKRTFYVDAIDGKGIYREKINKLGKHGFKGVVQIPNSNGELERFKFYKEFIVTK
ncbi:hypothetical protein [uncultured Draconibacterium sp.]|uniref:hypothetical protein n=1 Tax=uncultured Draconibacterium sp. TaxID=1573823 RepID=UPI003216B7F3